MLVVEWQSAVKISRRPTRIRPNVYRRFFGLHFDIGKEYLQYNDDVGEEKRVGRRHPFRNHFIAIAIGHSGETLTTSLEKTGSKSLLVITLQGSFSANYFTFTAFMVL